MKLAGEIGITIGGASGIGKIIALAIAKEGARFALVGINEKKVKKL
ncbi:hypothetical protein ACQKDD_15740 [Planococcus kocurii]